MAAESITGIPQEVFNAALSAVGLLTGFLLHAVWQAVKDLQEADKSLTAKVNEIEVLVAGDYVKKSEFDNFMKAVFAKLDKIEDKLDKKVDK